MDENTLREMILLDLKKGSREYPLEVSDLSHKYCLKNAEVRKQIAILRGDGNRICSKGKGYWFAKDEADYLAFRKIYANKIYARLDRLKAMDGHIQGQIEMWG